MSGDPAITYVGSVKRERIAGHDATEFNPAWSLEHVTSPDGIDEYSFKNGAGWLVFDPREAGERQQMQEIARAFDSALNRATFEELDRRASEVNP